MVFVTINVNDIENNSTLIAYSFNIHQDIIAPAVNNINFSTEISTNISFEIADTETGISWNTLSFVINGSDTTASLNIVSENIAGTANYTPAEFFNWGQDIAATISVQDVSGNETITTFSFTTDIPTTPELPVLNWLDQGPNSEDSQIVKITRPNVPVNVEAWRVIGNTDWLNIEISSVNIENLADNQTVSFSIQWRDNDTLALSNISNTASISIGDRTAPYFITANFAPLADASDIPTNNNIYFELNDDHSAISLNSIIFVVNGTDRSAELTSSNYQFTYDPANDFYYNDMVFVTINVNDTENNSSTISYQFHIHQDVIAPDIQHTIEETNRNPELTFTISDTETGISLNSIQFFINDLDKTASLNIIELSPFNYTISYTSLITYNFGQLINVTLNAQDISGNIVVLNFNFNINSPARPSDPLISWTNSNNINTEDEQLITLSLPADDLDGIFLWRVSTAQGNGTATSNWLPISTTEVNYTVSDNQAIAFAIQYKANEDNLPSDESNISYLQITDKTAPTVNYTYPEPQKTNIDVTDNISLILSDENSFIDISKFQIIIEDINGQTTYNYNNTIYSINGNTLAVTINLPQMEYNDIINGSVVVYDIYGNHPTTYNWTFSTVTDNIPPAVTDFYPVNNAKNIDTPCSINFKLLDAISDIDISSLAFILNGEEQLSGFQTQKIANGYYIEFTPANLLDYWTTFNITINIKDNARNEHIFHTTFKTISSNIHEIENDRYYRTIQEAVNRSAANNTIELLSNDFLILQEIKITKNITLQAATECRTTLNGQSNHRIFIIEPGLSVTLNNLNIINGKDSNSETINNGGAVYLKGNNYLFANNCHFTNNSSINGGKNGGVFYNNNGTSKVIIKNSLFENNNADKGGVFANDGTLLEAFIYSSVFKNNSAVSYGGIFYQTSANIQDTTIASSNSILGGVAYNANLQIVSGNILNNKATNSGGFSYLTNVSAARTLFYKNSAANYSAISYKKNLYFENCVFYSNTAAQNTLAYSNESDPADNTKIINSIIWNNSNNLLFNTTNTNLLSVEYCNIQTNNHTFPKNNCITSEPKFISATNLNFNLANNDPGIEKGTNNLLINNPLIYDNYDLGKYEYTGTYISNISPENGETGVKANRTTINFRVRSAESNINQTNIKLFINDLPIPTEQLSFIDNSIGTSADINVTLVTTNAFNYNQVVTLKIAATDNIGNSQNKTSSFTMENAIFKELLFTPETMNLNAEATYNIKVIALDALDQPMANKAVTFRLINNSTANNTTLYEPLLQTTNSSGIASINIYLGKGDATVIVGAVCEEKEASPLTINALGLIYYAQNLNLNKEYISLAEALKDSELSAGHVINIDSRYENALDWQKIDTLNWPNINNLTLQGENTTVNFNINITENITATINNLIFANRTTKALYLSGATSTINILNSKFININNSDGAGIYANGIRVLNIENCTFTKNIASLGGAINAYNVDNVVIKSSDFYENEAERGGGLYVRGDLTRGNKVSIKQSRFLKNKGLGSAVYINDDTNNAYIENSIFAENNNSAIYLYTQNTSINHSTIAANTLGIDSRIGNIDIYNSILWNTNSNDITTANSSSKINTSYSIVSSNKLSGSNVSHVNPLLTPQYYIYDNSPAIDTGVSNNLTNIDIEGSIRPQGVAPDIGAYEVPINQYIKIDGGDFYNSLQEALNAVDHGQTIELFQHEFKLTQSLLWPNKNNISIKNRPGTDPKNIIINGSGQELLINNNYNVNINLEGISFSNTNTLIKFNEGTSITANISNCHINNINSQNLLVNGTIVNSNVATLNINITNSTIKDCFNSGNNGLFYNNNKPLNINLTGSNIENIRGASNSLAKNAVIKISNSTISTFNITNSIEGSGLAANSKIVILDSTIANGTGTIGGLFSNSAIEASNSIFRKISARKNGGLIAGSTATFNSCVLYDNNALYFNTGIADNSNITIKESVLWNNKSNYDLSGGEFNNCDLNITYSCTERNYTGQGNFSKNPEYTDAENGNFTINFLSPLIDKGTASGQYTYDAKDIGHYEYKNTYINNFWPAINSQEAEISTNISFRVRNSQKKLDAANFWLKVDGTLYVSPNTGLKITDLSSAISSDILIEITPAENFRYSKVITVNFVIDNINHTYTFKTAPPEKIHVANTGNDLTNDGTSTRPLKTIAKAFDIAIPQCIIVLDNAYIATENIIWPAKSELTIKGNHTSLISANINIPADITANIEQIKFKGLIENNGRLIINGLKAADSEKAIINNGSLTIINSIFNNNTVVLENRNSATIYHSNFINNELVFANYSTITAANNIIFNNTVITSRNSVDLNNCLVNTDPLFIDQEYIEIKHNSPAVDNGLELSIATKDIYEINRPQHHKPDIGAKEISAPSIYVKTPANKTSTKIQTTIEFDVIDNTEELLTINIGVNISGNISFIVTNNGYSVLFIPNNFFNTATTYNISLTAKDTSENLSTEILTFRTEPHFTDIFIDKNSVAVKESGEAAFPFKTIQNGINYLTTNQIHTATMNIISGNYQEVLSIENSYENLRLVGSGNVSLNGENNKQILKIIGNNNILLKNLVFLNGSATYGGAISIETGSIVTIEDCQFKNNLATLYGGAIYNKGTLILKNTLLESNKANQNGGALYNEASSKIFIYNSLFRSNQSITYHGGAIYNNNYTEGKIVNTLFDYNTAPYSGRDGGAIYNSYFTKIDIYNSNFIRNTANDDGGAIYNTGETKITNTIFYENNGDQNYKDIRNIDKAYLENSLFSGALPTGLTSLSSCLANISSTIFFDIGNKDYRPIAGAACIDTGKDISAIVTKDIANNTRPLDGNKDGTYTFDIGIYEYKAIGINAPAGEGYYCEDELGNRENLSPTATITIGRELNNKFIGSITIPASNGFDLSEINLTSIVITYNTILVPADSPLDQHIFIISLPTTKHPFIRHQNLIKTDYYGSLINNEDQAITGNPVIDDLQNRMTFTATATGSYSLSYADKITLEAQSIFGNHNTTDNISIKIYDKNNSILKEIPAAISISGAGTLSSAIITENIIYTHAELPETAVATVNFEELTVTVGITTYFDNIVPTISIISPADLVSEIAVTTAISILITDDNSGIATSSLKILLNNTDKTASFNRTGDIYAYSERLLVNTEYNLTVNVQDNGKNRAIVTANFKTKNDLTAPIMSRLTPGVNENNVLPSAKIAFALTDLEAGLDLNSLLFTVKGSLPLTNEIEMISDGYALAITYNASEQFELLETVPVTISIKDLNNNLFLITYNFTITDDFIKPVITVITPAINSTNNHQAATINFELSDDNSGINTANINLFVNNQRISRENLIIEQTGRTYNISYKPLWLGYEKEIAVQIAIEDLSGNTNNISYKFQTLNDTLLPVITAITPLPGAKQVDIFSPLVIKINDSQTGVNSSFSSIKINGETIPYNLLTVSNTTFNCTITYNPVINYDYLTTINIEVITFDRSKSANQQYISYSFFTSDDIYAPAAPVINCALAGQTTNVSSFTISGEIEYGNTLNIYVNNVLFTTKYIRTEYPYSLFNIPLELNLTGNINIYATAEDGRQNISGRSNEINFNITDKQLTENFSGTTIDIKIPAGAVDLDVEVNITTPNSYFMLTDWKNIELSYVIELEMVATGNDLGKTAPSTFKKPIEITLYFPNSINVTEKHQIYYYNNSENKWKNDGITIISYTANSITFTTTHFTVFGLVTISNSTELASFDLILAPNPVKLESEPLHFVYNATNPGTAEVRIYTISGELLIKFQEDLLTGINEFTWDGENNYNDQIANGVYLVYIKLTDNVTGETHYKKKKLAVLN